MLWNKVYASKEQAIFIGPSRKPRNRTLLEVAAGGNLYIAAEKIRTIHQLLRCTLVANTSETWLLKVERPFHFTPSVNFFAEHYEKVRSGPTLAAYAIETCNLRICHAADGTGQIVADVHKRSCSKMFDLHSKTNSQQIKDREVGGELDDKNIGPGEDNQDENMAADDDDDDEEYGLALLRKHVAADLGKDTVSEEVAAAASLAEACSSEVDGDLEGVAVRELVEKAAYHIDTELDMMSRFEEEVFQKAVAEKTLSVEELQPQINSLLRAGMSEEEAVFEAALNSSKLLGNAANMGSAEPEPAAGPSGSSPSATAADPPVGLGVSGTDTDELDGPDGVFFSMTAKQMSHRCFVTYSAAFSESIGAVLQCLHARATSVPDSSGISLAYSLVDVAGPPSFPSSAKVILISWEVPGKSGRVARVDSEGRLVSMVCVGVNRTARDLRDCCIIHPNIGVSMERVRKKERPQVASYILRVSKMFVQAESMQITEAEEVVRELDLCGDGEEGVDGVDRWLDVAQGGEECVACGSVELPKNNTHGSGAQSSRRASFAEQCPLCLLPWHVDCCHAFVEKFRPSLQQIQLHPTPATQAESWLRLRAES